MNTKVIRNRERPFSFIHFPWNHRRTAYYRHNKINYTRTCSLSPSHHDTPHLPGERRAGGGKQTTGPSQQAEWSEQAMIVQGFFFKPLFWWASSVWKVPQDKNKSTFQLLPLASGPQVRIMHITTQGPANHKTFRSFVERPQFRLQMIIYFEEP